MALSKKKKVKQNFGKGTEVIVISPESPYYNKKGRIDTHDLNDDGEYAIAFEEGGRHFVSANDLDTAPEENTAPDSQNDEPTEESKRGYKILEASIKDGYCNYVYLVTRGHSIGEKAKIDGPGFVMPELNDAFGKLRVHLACADDAFFLSGIEFENINEHHGHELASRYHVTGFKIQGGIDNETVVLIGNKYVYTTGSRADVKSAKIPLDNLSSYKFYAELADAIAEAREQVAEYKEGYYEIPEEEESTDIGQSVQLTIGDAIAQAGEDSNIDLAQAEI